MAGPTWKLEDDQKTVIVTFPTDPPVGLRMDAAGLDEVLQNLGSMRARMAPEIPIANPVGKVEAIPDPAWKVDADAMTEGALLSLRDSRFGWLTFLFKKPEAEKLLRLLQVIVVRQTATAPSSRPN